MWPIISHISLSNPKSHFNSVYALNIYEEHNIIPQFQIGLVEKEWLDTLATINPSEVTFTDYVEAGAMLARELKEKGCDYVIALTHMRTPNDVRSG